MEAGGCSEPWTEHDHLTEVFCLISPEAFRRGHAGGEQPSIVVRSRRLSTLNAALATCERHGDGWHDEQIAGAAAERCDPLDVPAKACFQEK